MAEARGLNGLSICLAAGLLTATLSSTSHSAECFPGPDFQAPAGTRWQYQRDTATNKGCWHVEKANVRRAARIPIRSLGFNEASAASQQSTQKRPSQTARREITPATPATADWFSPHFWGRPDLPDAYQERDQDELRRPILIPERSHGSRATSKAIRETKDRPNKIALGKPSPEHLPSGGAHDRYSISAVARLEAAGDKPIPGRSSLGTSDLKKAIEAVGDKDVVSAPARPNEDWQQTLYEEFLIWRLKQVGLKQLETKRRDLRDQGEK
jgi:hypothetical protein